MCAREYLQLNKKRNDRVFSRKCLTCPAMVRCTQLSAVNSYEKDFFMMSHDRKEDYHCFHESEGCHFQGTQNKLDHHIQSKCMYRTISCRYCQLYYQAHEDTNHVPECPHRFQCFTCLEYVPIQEEKEPKETPIQPLTIEEIPEKKYKTPSQYKTLYSWSASLKRAIIGIEEDLTDKFQEHMGDSKLMGDALNRDKRNSKNAWVPTTHWTAGFVWHYVERANRENFLYDIRNIDGENMQFTQYGVGEFYGWHNDAGISGHYKPVSVGNHHEGRAQDYLNENLELVRKLSFVIQLSDPDDYEGGNLQLLAEDGKSYFAPRKRGTVVVFDSRTQHRVLKVTSGVRKSLVGWVVGSRWK